MTDTISVEVVAGLPERQILVELELPSGASVGDAIERSRILRRFPAISRGDVRFGVWGKVVATDHILKTGDRVEVYRPLAIDPREARRKLARVGKTMRGS